MSHDDRPVSVEMFNWMMDKPQPELVTRSRCRSAKRVDSKTFNLPPFANFAHALPQDRSTHRDAGPCMRPMWGSDPEAHRGLCSRCWHEWLAFNGTWKTMKANPASHDLGEEGIAKLTFARAGDPLPEVGAERDWDAEMATLVEAEQDTAEIDSAALWAELEREAADDEPWGMAA